MKIGGDMKYGCFILAIVASAFLSCTREKVEAPETITIRAYQEGALGTRTTLIDGGTQVYWEPADEIMVFYQHSSGRFVSGNTELAGVAEFSGTLTPPEGAGEGYAEGDLTWGLYPYRDDATFDGSSVTTTLPAEQTGRAGSFARNTHIALAQSDSHDLAFYNVCGGVRFSLTQEGISRITFEGNNGETLAGRINIAFKGGVPIIEEVMEDETLLSLTAPDGGTFQTGEWYYIEALPEDLDNGFRMTFYKENASASFHYSNAVTISRGKYGSLADVDAGLVFAGESYNLFPAVIPLNEESISGYVVNESQRTCTISFSDQVPDIKSGSVVCLPPGDGDNGIFLVTSASVNGNTVDMHWQHGDLSYVFRNTSFTLSTRDAGSAYAPRKASRAGKASQPYDWALWRGEYAETFTLLDNNDVSLKSSFTLTSGIDAEFTFDFYGDVTSIIDGIHFLKSKDFTTSFKLLGSLNCHSDFIWKVKKEASIDLSPGEEDKEELVKHNFLPPIDFPFPVGPITVPIHLGCDLYHEVRADVSGELELTAAIDLDCYGETGFSYDGHGGAAPFQTFNSFGVNVTKHNPTLSGWGEVSGTYYVIPRIYAWVAYMTGPALEIRPYAKTTLTGAFQKDLVESSTDDFLSATFKASVGAEWAVGISTPLENYFYEASRTMMNLGVIKEFDVAKSPVALALASASSDKVYKDTYTALKFSVLADYYGVRARSYFPTIVKIEVPASGISTYKYTWNGEVDYAWTPRSDEEVLYAKIYDKEGKVIDQVKFGEGTNDDDDEPGGSDGVTAGKAIDLGLPSGLKWASMNVGASRPEEYGDYFAWGETEPYYKAGYAESTDPVWKSGKESGYDWPSYKFWVSGDWGYIIFNKYCTQIHQWDGTGPMDNKRVLDLEDDAAHVNWGGSWRIPTDAEWDELLNNCTWTRIKLNGILGVKLIGPNGNSIFFPFTNRWWRTVLSSSYCCYWSSSLNADNPYYANIAIYSRDYFKMSGYGRCAGYPVRPVTK